MDKKKKQKLCLAVVTGLILAAACGFLAFSILTHSGAGDAPALPDTAAPTEAVQQEAVKAEEAEPAHQHTWVPTYRTVHHDAVYEDVYHAPVYTEETTYHTVCNDCKEIIDGMAAEHVADTGHSGYSTGVPIVNETLASAGYTESALVQDAWDEVVTDGAMCPSCGETAPEAVS